MKYYTVVGFNKYSGDYEGKPYSGYYLHCLCDDAGPDFEGQRVTQVKAKSKYGYVPRVGDRICVQYGEFGIESIQVA